MSLKLGTTTIAGLPDVSGKVNTDMDNLTATGKSYAAGIGMPSNNYEDLTLGANGATYTAPANGYVTVYGTSGNSLSLNVSDENGNPLHESGGTWSFNQLELFVPVQKNQTFVVWYAATVQRFRFIYAEGEV